MQCPDLVEFVEAFWVEPIDDPIGGWTFVLQGPDGAHRLALRVCPERAEVGWVRRVGTATVDRTHIRGVQRLYFADDGRLFGEATGGVSFFIDKDPVPSVKLTVLGEPSG